MTAVPQPPWRVAPFLLWTVALLAVSTAVPAQQGVANPVAQATVPAAGAAATARARAQAKARAQARALARAKAEVQQAQEEARLAAEVKALEEAKAQAEAKAVADAKEAADAQIAAEAKAVADAQAAAAAAEAAKTRVQFTDLPIFDRELSTMLGTPAPTVNVAFYDRVKPSDLPDRLQRWMAAVESGGGKVKVTPPPSTVTAKNPFLLLSAVNAIFNISKASKAAAVAALYKSAETYDADIQLKVDDKGDTVVDRVVFSQRAK